MSSTATPQIAGFTIGAPLPARGSAMALREQLVEHLMRVQPSVGDRFLSDHELARIAQISRPTVRKAMDHLERAGWIERRPGIGTFIGPRAAVGGEFASPGDEPARLAKRTVRLALMIHLMGDLGHDWYASGVMDGIDRAAEEAGVTLELLGDRVDDARSVARRLQQTRPDVLAFAAPTLRHMGLICEATRLGIPCVGTGTLAAKIGIPAVCEDGAEASQRGVKYLRDHGHRRIGYVTASYSLPWVFDRRRGYMDGMSAAGLDADEGMVLWLTDADDQELRTRQLQSYLERRQPTALLVSSWSLVQALAPLVQSGEIRVPRDLSVLTFDQSQQVAMWLGVRPTVLSMPLVEMGKRLAYSARELAMGKTAPDVATLACNLVEGESVLTLASRSPEKGR